MEKPNVTPEDWEEQLIHFSLGTMEPDEAARFSAALEQCRSRAQLAHSYSQVFGLLAATVPPAEPPEGHKSRLMELVVATPQVTAATGEARPAILDLPREPATTPTRAVDGRGVAGVPARRRAAAWVWAAGIAAAVLIAVLAALLVATLGTVERQAARLAEVEREIAELREQVNIPPGYRTIALAPTAEYTGVSALVIYNPDSTEAWLVAGGLTPLPEDLIYELWLIRPPDRGQSEVGGVFGPTESGTAVHRTAASERIAEYAGFAVSIERKPGVTVREGPVVVVGRFEEQ